MSYKELGITKKKTKQNNNNKKQAMNHICMSFFSGNMQSLKLIIQA